ncbi:MAG TPA: LysM peptidoglycan-binding domain-containing protein [Polyangiaceae bacterium]|nr:LysM peptidoglycan-binding domain-containing protein [Polyangiaceae bacterium]
MRWPAVLLGLLLSSMTAPTSAAPTLHTVAEGQSLGRIAKRYQVSIEAICGANGFSRRDKLRPGQKLVIPDPNDKDGSDAVERLSVPSASPPLPTKPSGALQRLQLRSGTAYYYEPSGAGRLGMKPVIVYLHARGGHPEQDCQRWARLTRKLGWLVCPSGPVAHGSGRAWNNNWLSAQRTTMDAIQQLRERYGRRVQLYGNTLVGFSEGAYAAMNVGVREPRTFNRWLILAADSTYWGGPGLDALQTARERVRRVYLITGQRDEVVDGTRQVDAWLRRARVTTKISTPADMGHELPLERKPFLFEQALRWLNRDDQRAASGSDESGRTASR